MALGQLRGPSWWTGTLLAAPIRIVILAHAWVSVCEGHHRLVVMNEAGFYRPAGLEDRYPRIQILAIEELLAAKGVAYPRLLEVTFKKAPKARKAAEEQMALGGDGR